jgi:ankyrin repeat protein
MPRPLSPATSLDLLKNEAKRWLRAIRRGDDLARARLKRALADAPDAPMLRDVQRALAHEYGFAGWTTLKRKVAEIAAQRGQSPRATAIRSLLSAADQGDAAAVAKVLADNPDVIDERGTLDGHTGLRTALHFGVRHEAIVRVLLERGADPNIRDEGDNAFPLHFAAERGDLAVIQHLVEHGADTVAGDVDDHELDIIGWATAFEYVPPRPDVVEYLLAHGAKHTMFSAVATGATDAIRELATRSRADVNKRMDRTNHRRRPLHLAVVKRQPVALAALIDLGADLEGEDAAGLTALDQAALAGEREMAQMLIDCGARVKLPAAVCLGLRAETERLLRDDPVCLKPGGRWSDLIVRAATYGLPSVIETLIQHGASPNTVADAAIAIDQVTGYTPLHAAAWNGHTEAAAVLLRHGADPRLRDGKYCGTPAGWARYNGKRACCDLILDNDRIDIFDAITNNRPDRIPAIVERDPAALHRPFGAYAACDAESAHLTPLAWATVHDQSRAVRFLMSRGAELASGGVHARTHEERLGAFLRMACLDWAVGGPERQMHTAAAGRLLQRHPELAREHFLTAVICGDVDEVERVLAARPAAAVEACGPRGWPPLLYLANARLPGTDWAENAVAIARALLDRDADPKVYYEGGDPTIHYTALTCVMGRGEEQAPVHPKARQLAALLLDRGAEPYDRQFFYNAFAGHASQRHLRDDDFVWLLDLIYEHSIRRGRRSDWDNPDWAMLGMGGYGCGAWYLLFNALRVNSVPIAAWALSHGANPNPPRPSDARTPPGTLYEQAVRKGLQEFAALLASYGGDALAAAPHAANAVDDLFNAAEYDRAALVAHILADGVSPNVEKPKEGTRPLHVAAYHEAVSVVRLLIDRGADIDPRDAVHGATPIYWAHWGGSRRAVDLLTPYTRDIWALTSAGKLERLRELIAVDPSLARGRNEFGTVLFHLPEDERVAAAIVSLLLANGADPSVTRPDGMTAADIARARGLDRAAERLGIRD